MGHVRGRGQGHVSAGLAALHAAAGRRAIELDQDKIGQHPVSTLGRGLVGDEESNEGSRRGTSVQSSQIYRERPGWNNGKEKTRAQNEREHDLEAERQRKHERDTDLG